MVITPTDLVSAIALGGFLALFMWNILILLFKVMMAWWIIRKDYKTLNKALKDLAKDDELAKRGFH